MIGDAPDIFGRLRRLMPPWFGQDRAPTPVLDGLLKGPATALARVHEFYSYAQLQTRIETATGGWLDLIAMDFFAGTVVRREGESDEAFRSIIVAELFRPKATREAIVLAITALTGEAPIVFEPRRPLDTGGYDVGGAGYDLAGGWGSYDLPAQAFVTVKRPHLSGIPDVSGWDIPFGGFDTASPLQWAPNADFAAVADAAILATLNRVRPAGVTLWTRIVDSFDNLQEIGGGEALNFPDDWTHRAPVVIQESRISNQSTLTNFPVLLIAACVPPAFLDSDNFQGDGGDIRFTADEAGSIPLACEVVSFAGNSSPASSTCEIWVKVPSVAPDVNTTFYMWRRSGVGVAQRAVDHPAGRNAVWSDYLGVWHGDDLTDATGNGNDLTAFGGATFGAEAQIGNAFQLSRASSQYFSAGSAAAFDNLAAMTVQCWARNTLAVNYSTHVCKTPTSGDLPWHLYSGGGYQVGWAPTGGAFAEEPGPGQNAWGMISAGYGGSGAASALLMTDGVVVRSFDRGASLNDDAAGNLLIGYAEGGGGGSTYFDGQIDEVRLRAEYLSADWGQADYENQANPALFSIPGAVTAL